MRCEKCGFTNSPIAKFCKQCGAPQPHTAVAAPESTTENPAAHEQAPPVGGALCPQCAAPRVQGKRFCRQCRFDFMASSSAPIATGAAIETASQMRPQDRPRTVAARTSETGGRGSRFRLVGMVAVLVAGIAGAAGYLLYEQHAKSSALQAAALSPSETIVTSQTMALLASGKPQQAAGIDAVPEAQASAVKAEAAPTAASNATVAEPPATTANIPALSADNLASATVAAPISAASQPAGQIVDNGVTRAAVARNLVEGNRCFNDNKFDCALSKANAALRLDPHNEQAASLLRRTKTVLVLPPYNRVFSR